MVLFANFGPVNVRSRHVKMPLPGSNLVGLPSLSSTRSFCSTHSKTALPWESDLWAPHKGWCELKSPVITSSLSSLLAEINELFNDSRSHPLNIFLPNVRNSRRVNFKCLYFNFDFPVLISNVVYIHIFVVNSIF